MSSVTKWSSFASYNSFSKNFLFWYKMYQGSTIQGFAISKPIWTILVHSDRLFSKGTLIFGHHDGEWRKDDKPRIFKANGNNVYSSQLPSNVNACWGPFVCLFIKICEFPRHVQHAALATLNIQYLSTHIACLLSHYYTPVFLLFVVQRIENFIKMTKERKNNLGVNCITSL